MTEQQTPIAPKVKPSECEPYNANQNPHKHNRGLVRAWHAAINSWSGLVFAWREESAFRQELLLAVVLLPIAICLPVGIVERVLMVGSVLLVLIIELINSSIEAAIDRISLDKHPLSKRAKDFGSAAVMLALFGCAITWGMIIWSLLQKST